MGGDCSEKQNAADNKQSAASGDPAGIRTPDTLLKRQVLCLLSYWVILNSRLNFQFNRQLPTQNESALSF